MPFCSGTMCPHLFFPLFVCCDSCTVSMMLAPHWTTLLDFKKSSNFSFNHKPCKSLPPTCQCICEKSAVLTLWKTDVETAVELCFPGVGYGGSRVQHHWTTTTLVTGRWKGHGWSRQYQSRRNSRRLPADLENALTMSQFHNSRTKSGNPDNEILRVQRARLQRWLSRSKLEEMGCKCGS